MTQKMKPTPLNQLERSFRKNHLLRTENSIMCGPIVTRFGDLPPRYIQTETCPRLFCFLSEMSRSSRRRRRNAGQAKAMTSEAPEGFGLDGFEGRAGMLKGA